MIHAYFMTVVDGVFCMGRAPDKQMSTIVLDWSVIMGRYDTADSLVTDRTMK